VLSKPKTMIHEYRCHTATAVLAIFNANGYGNESLRLCRRHARYEPRAVDDDNTIRLILKAGGLDSIARKGRDSRFEFSIAAKKRNSDVVRRCRGDCFIDRSKNARRRGADSKKRRVFETRGTSGIIGATRILDARGSIPAL